MATELPEYIELKEPIEVPSKASEIPKYAAFQHPTVVAGKLGSAPGEFKWPRGVAIEDQTGHIYVTDMGNSRVQVLSQAGEYINAFGATRLASPYGIMIQREQAYVTDYRHHAIFLFQLPELRMIKRVGQRGSGKEEFHNPCQLAVSPNQHLYVADLQNNRIQILTTKLTFKDSLQHQTMTLPVDVKFSKSEMFVLSVSNEDNPCTIHLFTLSGERSRSLFTRGNGMRVSLAFFFCLDRHDNILISNCSGNNIEVFSPEGHLLHKILGYRGRTTQLCSLRGLAVSDNNKLICVSDLKDFSILIYSDKVVCTA